MKRIDQDFKNYIGQGENPDLFVSVVGFDRRFDEYFGIDYKESEKKLSTTDDYIYPNLQDSALLTSYLDYYQVYEDLADGDTLVDVGAGYCRGTFLFNELGGKECISIEREASRINAARTSLSENLIIEADLLAKNFMLPKREAYFIYLPLGVVLYEVLKKIIDQNIEAIFYVVESHGDLVDYFLIHSEIFELIDTPFKVSLPRHRPYIYKFKSKKIKTNKESISFDANLPLWHLYNNHKDIKLNIESTIPGSEKKNKWIAKLKGSTLIKYNGETALYLEKPARILQIDTQDKILSITR